MPTDKCNKCWKSKRDQTLGRNLYVRVFPRREEESTLQGLLTYASC